ncbi:MAG TPA: peptidoglycan DD-metalloendopeptidase family protein [Actinomycetota bacterium]|nr:peptidoglycan DD-metalloendopeptidase family protein [Actinomycetota bacterium]
MHGRLGRTSIVATLLCTLLIPAAGSLADSDSKLDKIKNELGHVREEIEARESKAGSLQDEVDELNDQMIALRKQLGRLDARLTTVEASVRSAQARIDETQKKIDRIKDEAVEQAVSLYKAGSTETIDALLNAESLTELDSRVEMLGVAAEKSTGALIEYGRLRVTIEAQNRDLFERKAELEAVKEEQSKHYAALDEHHEKLAVKLAELEKQLGHLHAHEGELEDAANAITARIQANSAKADVAALGESAGGFIWPLNGAITSYYGPRWGSMHTGIDIDGTTGQPIVASKAGTVIMAGVYSGYGNAVIVDHGGGIQTLYAHLSAFAVSNGQSVSQGQVVGNVGCTGSCTGDHLHFEVRVNGSPVDPMSYLP